MRYEVSTNKGNLVVEATSDYEARRRCEQDGLSVYSVRSHYGTAPVSPGYDNAGSLSADINGGGFGVGLGGGLVVESDGDLGVQIAPGISIDTGLGF